MALNRKPRRPITDADRSFAGRDSLVCLRQVRGQDSVDPLRPLAKRIVGGEEYSGRLPGCPGRSLARRASTFHPLVFELPGKGNAVRGNIHAGYVVSQFGQVTRMPAFAACPALFSRVA